MTFWVRTETPNLTAAYVVLGDDDIATNQGAVMFLATISGYWALSLGTASYELAPYVTGQWYRVDLSFDWVGKTVDVSIDGIPRQYNVPFLSPSTTSLTRLHFYNFYNTMSYLDQI